MSVDLMEMLKGAVSQQVMGKLGGALGMEPKKTSTAFEMASAAILGGLMKKAGTPQGAQTVFESAKKQDTSILDKLGDLMGGGPQTEQLQKSGGGLLESILGGSQAGMLAALAKSLGIDQSIINKLVAMLGPIVMAVLGKHIKAKALDAVGLGGLLGDQKKSLSKYLPPALATNLGFSDMLGNASASVTGAANSAKQMGRSAANEAAEAGGGLLKLLVPVVIIGLLGWALWAFVLNKKPTDVKPNAGTSATAPAVPQGDQPKLDLGSIDMAGLGEAGATLKNGFSDITTGLTNLKDEAGANKLKESISGFTGKIDGLGLNKLSGVAKTTSGSMINQFVTTVKDLLDKVPGPLKAIVSPAVDKLLEKLQPFMS